MKKFHILWAINECPLLTTGETFEAETMEDALILFRIIYKGIEPIYVALISTL